MRGWRHLAVDVVDKASEGGLDARAAVARDVEHVAAPRRPRPPSAPRRTSGARGVRRGVEEEGARTPPAHTPGRPLSIHGGAG